MEHEGGETAGDHPVTPGAVGTLEETGPVGRDGGNSAAVPGEESHPPDGDASGERRRSPWRAEPGDHDRRYIRSPVFVSRLLISSAVAVALAVVPVILDASVAGLRSDLAESTTRVSPMLAGLFDAMVIVVALVVTGAALVSSVIHRAPRLTALIVAGVTVSALAVIGFESWAGHDITDQHILVIVAICVTGAVLTTQINAGQPGLHRIGWIALVITALLGAPWDYVGVPGRLEAIAVGIAIGSALALLIKTASLAATPRALQAALADAGIPSASVEEHGGDARGSCPWIVNLDTGRSLFVKTYSTEERSADLLFRTWRFLGLKVPDERPESSLSGAVEHEAFLGSRAGDIGVRAPRFIAMGPIEGGGMFAAYACVEGRTFDEIGADIDEPTLRATWSMVVSLHRAGIAHRDLRASNLLIDVDGNPWIVDFAFGQMAATPEQRSLDIVELLCSLTTLVGEERAVASARTVLGRETLVQALPFLQPMATSSATRQALGKKGFVTLRQRVRETTGTTEPDLPPLSVIRPKSVLTVVAFGAAVWVLLSQLANTGDLFDRLSDASLPWLLLAAGASAVTYIGAGMSMSGSVPNELPFGPTVASQLASSFINRVTPAQVGGAVLNVRYLTKQGNDTATATTAVGINSLAGAIVHVILGLIAVVWAGTGGVSGVQLPEARTFGLVAGAILAVLCIGWATPPLRRTFKRKIRPRLRQSWQAVVALSQQPTKILLAFGGSTIVTVSYLVALIAAMHAFGATPGLAVVGVVYLAGSALASAAPTPSGLGATEAILAAGFIATGVDQSTAVAGVLLFRGATFWLPIIPGWLCFLYLQRTDRI